MADAKRFRSLVGGVIYLTHTKPDIAFPIYVDDIIYTSSSTFLVNEFKSQMMNEFEMSDMGLLHYFLGLEVYQAEDAKDLLSKFGMLNCKSATTPMNINGKLQQEDKEKMADAKRFRSLVGGLIYLTHTKPDIAFPISVIYRFMQQPSTVHYGAAKRVLRYITGTLEYGVWYSKTSNFRLCGFTDTTAALSTSEAEYIASTSAACQAIWLRRVLADLQHEQKGAMKIFCDNKATITMTKNPTFHGRTKHIDIRYHFIRDLVQRRR
ncbi:Retrovirus-related Pol polyprotein from transposon TNT 1-94 [Gossypium australe]|uniref:Retrovirus-related Pol polyprotein from transposon TNT 1-94 n=1 Tax=Gossypium australe TaxID=47621 RepID=A0A5B6VDH4_9ROSI|nr:Retrovirus-related Pol polyprotein from transposon TNT 1-94 [Gossypium australe]